MVLMKLGFHPMDIDASRLRQSRAWEKEILDKVKDLRDLGVDNVLQIDLLARLAVARSTAWGLAGAMFGSQDNRVASRGEYMRTIRSLASLERKGFVAKALFGKEKPYHLTRHGEEAVRAIMGDMQPLTLIPRKDFLSYIVAALAAATSLALTFAEAGSLVLIFCWLGTGIITGLCLRRFVETVRRIM